MKRQIGLLRAVRTLLSQPSPDLSAALGKAIAQLSEISGGGRYWLFLPDAAEVFRLCPTPDDDPAGCPTEGIGTLKELQAAIPRTMAVDGAAQFRAVPGLGQFLTARRASGSCVLAPLREGERLIGLLCHAPAAGTGEALAIALTEECAGLLGDVLARSHAEVQRAEVAARLEATLEAMPDLLFEIDADCRYTGFFTGDHGKLLMTPNNFSGHEVGEVLPPDVAELSRAAVRRVLDEGKAGGITYELALPDGRHTYEARGVRKPACGPDREPTAIFLVRDVTAEQAMREELRRLGSVTRAMSNLVAIMDPELRIVWVNPAFERHTGWTLDEIRGQLLADLVRCEESDPAEAAAVDAAIAAVRPYSGQTINKDRHGNRYHVDFNILPLCDDTGKLQNFVTVETVVTELTERKIAMEQLAEKAAAAQSRLENALNALPDSVLIFDADERLVVCNPAHRRIFDRMADILVPGLALRDLIRTAMQRGYFDGPERPEEVEAFLDRLMKPYRTASYDDELQVKDGRWFRRVTKRTSDGGLITVMIDISGRRRQINELDNANERLWRALEQRELAERRLSNIMDATRVGTWALDLTKGELNCCQHWARIIGLDLNRPITLAHQEFLDMVHPEDRAMLETSSPRAVPQSPDVFEHEFRMRHRDGHWVWVLSRGRIVKRDAMGQPILFDGVDIDISEQKRLEMEVRQSDALLTSALESNVAAFAIYNSQDVLLYCNSEAERILQLQPGLIYGRRTEAPTWSMEAVDGGPIAPENGPCNAARRAGGLIRDIRFAVRWTDGRRQVLTCNATPFDAGNGQMNTAISFWDITEQLETTERLQEALIHAQAMSKSKSIFLAKMSHEIRTPLNGVLGLAEVLSLQIKDPDQSRMIATIRRSGETLLSVLNSILDMSKIEAGKIEMERVPLRLSDVLQQIDAIYSIQAEEKGLDFEVTTSAGADLRRIGDPHRIQQVLGNLLSNAIKFTEEGGISLTVSCRPDKPVVFVVTDTGVGLSPDQSSRVFASFEQADGSITRRFGGTGLGLSIVRELVLLMGGEISLESELGVGTTVKITLPLPLAGHETQAIAGS